MTKDKSLDDEGILVNDKGDHVDDEGIGTEYYIQKRFNKTRTWPITKSVVKIKFVTIYLTKFTKKSCIFQEKSKNLFLGANAPLTQRELLETKLNITFFMGNEVLNIFSSKRFFDESDIFRENGKKLGGGTWPFFRRWGLLTPK